MTNLTNAIAQKIKRTRAKISKTGKNILFTEKIGYVVAAIKDEKVTIGFSLCCNRDRYDYIDGERKPGFGKTLALARADKWSNRTIIAVPPSIMPTMEKFAIRCDTYYKGLKRPEIIQQPQE